MTRKSNQFASSRRRWRNRWADKNQRRESVLWDLIQPYRTVSTIHSTGGEGPADTPFTRSSRHWANIEQTSNNYRVYFEYFYFARRLLDVCSIVYTGYKIRHGRKARSQSAADVWTNTGGVRIAINIDPLLAL